MMLDPFKILADLKSASQNKKYVEIYYRKPKHGIKRYDKLEVYELRDGSVWCFDAKDKTTKQFKTMFIEQIGVTNEGWEETERYPRKIIGETEKTEDAESKNDKNQE